METGNSRDYPNSIEEAIRNGQIFYWDMDFLNNEGKSAGIRCRRCKTWIRIPRKRKSPSPTFLTDCQSCEIKDPLRRIFHELNCRCNEEDRKVYNSWRSELGAAMLELEEFLFSLSCPERPNYAKHEKIKKLISKLPNIFEE